MDFIKIINKVRKPLSIFLCFCMTLGLMSTYMTRQAKADETRTNVNWVNATKFFNYTNQYGQSALLNVPTYVNTEGDITYCVEYEANSPASSVVYNLANGEDYLGDAYNGVVRILQWGYPLNTSFASKYDLTDLEAETATAVAIKKYLSAMGVAHSGCEWGFGESISAKAGYEKVYTAMDYLYNNAADGVEYNPEISAELVNSTSDKDFIYNEYKITTTAENIGIAINGIKNCTTKNLSNGNLLVQVPKYCNYGNNGEIEFIVKDSGLSSSVYFSTPESADYQNMVSVKRVTGRGNDTRLPITIEALGEIKVDKSDATTGEKLANALFGVYTDASCSEDSFVDYIITDENGYGSLSVGKNDGPFFVKELYAPAGYNIDDTNAKQVNVDELVSFTDTSRDTTISIHKETGDTHEPLEGVIFGIYTEITTDKDGVVDTVKDSLIQKMTTDAAGNATSTTLVPSTIKGTDEDGYTVFDENTEYYIQEIESANGYTAGFGVLGPVPAIGGINIALAYPDNYPKGGQIKVKKTDTKSGVNVAGAKYGIYTDIKCTTLAKYTYYDENTLFGEGTVYEDAIVTTGNDGVAVSKWLAPGTYYVKEIEAPVNYTISDEVKMAMTGRGVQTPLVEVSDDKVVGTISIVKKDADSNVLLSGAKYGLYSDAECNKLIKPFANTNEYGFTRIMGLDLGTYYVKEIEAPTGYELDTQVYTATLNYKDQNTGVISTQLNLTDKKIETGSIKFIKVNNAKEINELTKKDIPDGVDGAIIEVLDSKNNLIKTIITKVDKDGNAVEETVTGLTLGETYTFHEKYAPAGFNMASDIKVTVTKETPIKNVKMTDTLVRPEIKVIKVDNETSESLAGATFAIKNKTTGNVAYVTTDNKGVAKYNGVYGYSYSIAETKAPNGYALSGKNIDLVLTKNQAISVKNAKIEITAEAKITIKKIDENKDIVEGAKLAIYDKNNTKVSEFVSGKDLYVTKDLEVGEEYTLVEEYTPNGYLTAEPIKFTVQDGLIIEMVDYKTAVTVNKIDENKDIVKGAVLTIYDESNNIVDSWVTGDSSHSIKGLIAGKKYVLKETVTPDGYITAEDIEFVAQDGKVINMVDNHTTLTVRKIDEEKDVVVGAILTIYDAQGNEVLSFETKDEDKVIKGLTVGQTYTLVETTVPKGYVKAADIEFVFSNADTIEMVDNHITMVQTGDKTNTNLYIYLLGMSITLMLGFAPIPKFKKIKR